MVCIQVLWQNKIKPKELVIISQSLLRWNLNDFVYHPEFDLGIREEWLLNHPVARVGTSINVLNQDNSANNDDSTNGDDAEFWQSVKAIEDCKLIEVIGDKQPVSPLEKVPSAPEPSEVN